MRLVDNENNFIWATEVADIEFLSLLLKVATISQVAIVFGKAFVEFTDLLYRTPTNPLWMTFLPYRPKKETPNRGGLCICDLCVRVCKC